LGCIVEAEVLVFRFRIFAEKNIVIIEEGNPVSIMKFAGGCGSERQTPHRMPLRCG
jgi:hypothetical protein